MGEYANYKGQEIKIGTCENMYYLRADQAHKVQAIPNSLDPVAEAGSIRFRFPFPWEDHTEPGAFADYDAAMGVSGVTVPEDIEHGTLQFTRNYPRNNGVLLSTPCPFSKEGKASGLKFSLNSFPGQVMISQQRLIDGKLVLVCECGGCGAKYRLPTLEEAQPIINALNREGEDRKKEVAKRIEDGYTKPNPWTPADERAAVIVIRDPKLLADALAHTDELD